VFVTTRLVVDSIPRNPPENGSSAVYSTELIPSTVLAQTF